MPNELGQLIDAEVVREEKSFEGVRSRALSIVSVAGVLVTVLTGLLTIAATSKSAILSVPAHVSLAVALFAMVISTILALCINFAGKVSRVDIEKVKPLVEDDWDDLGWDQRVAEWSLDHLKSLQTANRSSIRLLTLAIGFQVVGAMGLAATALFVVEHLKS